jgi:hypothetical protein
MKIPWFLAFTLKKDLAEEKLLRQLSDKRREKP